MRKLIKIWLCLFCVSSFIYSKGYYIDSVTGNDSNSGTSVLAPWKSFANLYKFNILPGDTIFLKRGSVWREELKIPDNGNDSSFITITDYGIGDKPEILGSKKLAGWKKYSEFIWKNNIGNNYGWIWFVLKNNTVKWGVKKETVKSLSNPFDFFVKDSSVFIYSKENPDSSYRSIENSVRDFGIVSGWYSTAKNFININDLEILFTKNSGIRAIGSKNWKITNCVIHHNGTPIETDGQGIQLEAENFRVSKNQLFENGQHGIYISAFGNFPTANGLVDSNRIFNNYHTGIDIMSNGDTVNYLKNIEIKNNLIYDNKNFKGKEVAVQTYAFNSGKIKNIAIHHNLIFDIKGIGISVQDNSDSVFVFNNTVVSTTSACVALNNNNGYVFLANNLGYNENYYAVVFFYDLRNKDIDYNCWFTKSRSIAWVNNTYYKDWISYQQDTGFDKNGVYAEPLFFNERTYNFRLKINSPLLQKGECITLDKLFHVIRCSKSTNIGAF